MNGEEPNIDLGPCCCCEKQDRTVRNIMMLDKKSPIPGRGWGCLVCHLPLDGASYVCCDDCFEKKVPPKFACRGNPAEDGRIPIGELKGEHLHDEFIHQIDGSLDIVRPPPWPGWL